MQADTEIPPASSAAMISWVEEWKCKYAPSQLFDAARRTEVPEARRETHLLSE
jgi:hypothetical protein